MQGRGSAANSAVCYALGLTAVDPVGMDLLFERFLSDARGEWPDIDLDLPSGERREAVIQYVYRRYGRHGAGMTANVITYRGRSAAREVGKALGLPGELQDRLASLVSNWGYQDPADVLTRHLAEAGCDPRHPRIRKFAALWTRLQDLPRHLGQHSGGMVIAGRAPRRRRAAGAGHDAGPGGHPVGQGRLRGARHRQGRSARSADDVGAAGRHSPRERDGRRRRSRPPAARRPRGVPDAAARRHHRRVPGREPGPDGHAAADPSRAVLRPGGAGGDHPARAHRGRHGASLYPAPAGPRGGELSAPQPRADSLAHARRAAVPGAAPAHGHGRRRLQRQRGRGAAAGVRLQAQRAAHGRGRDQAAGGHGAAGDRGRAPPTRSSTPSPRSRCTASPSRTPPASRCSPTRARG